MAIMDEETNKKKRNKKSCTKSGWGYMNHIMPLG